MKTLYIARNCILSTGIRLSALLGFFGTPVLAATEPLVIWVSPDGSDADEGTQAAPFATIRHARDVISTLTKWENLEDIEVVVRPTSVWIVNYLTLASVDTRTLIAQTTLEGTYDLGKLRHISPSCWIENVIDFLDCAARDFSKRLTRKERSISERSGGL